MVCVQGNGIGSNGAYSCLGCDVKVGSMVLRDQDVMALQGVGLVL